MTSITQSHLIFLIMCDDYCKTNNTNTFQFDELVDHVYAADQISRRLLSRLEKIVEVMVRTNFIRRVGKDTRYGRTFADVS